jgi:flagellar hook-associated protein 1 FlgK
VPQIDPLSIAMSGLANVNRNLAVLSQNVANANTPGYVAETVQQREVTAGGQPMGVMTGLTVRDVDTALQGQLYAQTAVVGATSMESGALAQVDAVQGTPGSGSDIASLVGKLGDSFSTLLNDPSSTAQQQQVVSQAGALASQINATATVIGTQRQEAQDSVVSDVKELNSDLQQIGAISQQIVQLRATGGSTADLENQRDAVVQDASQVLDLRFIVRPNGDMMVLTTNGLQLPTDGTAPLAMADANIGPGSYYPGGGSPAVTLGGVDVTTSLTSGSLGAALTLRDTTLPTQQATLDEFAQTLASRFSSQGLTLFSDPSGNVPHPAGTVPRQGPYVGFSDTIQVNPAVVANPSLVRDGTNTIVGSAGGAQSFTPNPPGGPAGFSTMISRVLQYALTGDIAPGTAQPAVNLTQMGPPGSLSANYTTTPDLAGFATAVLTANASAASTASSAATTAQDSQTALQQNISKQSGVNIDAELASMVQLQNAYSANARMISTMQTLWSQLIQNTQ